MCAKSSPETEQMVARLYRSGSSGAAVAARCGVSESTVYNVLERLGLVRRSQSETHARHSLNTRYFAEIDTEEKAYWLGFIAADGCVRDDGKLTLCLSAADADHVRRFAAAVGYGGKVVIRTRPRDGRKFASVNIRRGGFAEGLAVHGVAPRKTWDLNPWKGPPHLMRHYWRGMVDGDGCLSTGRSPRGRKLWTVELVGTRPVVEAFAEFIHQVAHTKPMRVRPHGTIWRTRIAGVEQPQLAARLLYADCTVALPRKQELAQAMMSLVPERSHLHLLTVGGVTRPLREWAAESGIKAQTLLRRVQAGDDSSRLFRGLRCPPRFITHEGKTLHLSEWARRTGINHQTISARLARGLSPAEALSARGTNQ